MSRRRLPILPCEGCGAKCCHFAPFTEQELAVAKIANGGLPEGATVIPAGRTKAEFGSMPIVLVVKGDEMRCAFVDEHARCSIYEVRPKPCREYGKHKQMPCQELEPDKASKIGGSDAARQLDILRNGS